MNALRLLYLFRVHVLFFVAIILSLVLYFSNESNSVKSVQADIADIVSIVLSPKKWYQNILNTKEKNEYLIQSVSQLRLLNSELIHLKYENDEFRKMLNFKESSPLSLLGSTVVNNQLSGFIKTLTLNSGKNDGVLINLPIIDMYGLVGKTITVGDRASLVQLITDKNFRVSVKTGQNWNLGLFIPTHGKFGNIEGIPKSQKVEPGNLVITSGISKIYPKDIPVARVVSVEVDLERPFLQIVAEVKADIYNSDYVFIIQ
ncbi:MAG: rod shape-determining protein MreC [Candidatus Marinimicrobia bacterium]|nr:rod shape-determining protein MreC [Candidatus Neomarinimicrobiota bacterium]|tara:strand:+ start:2035 stop:2811 length:777 start_codon:yes stop_codon:yes gene_type:complete